MNERAFISHCDFLCALRRNPALNAVEGQELVTLLVEYLEEAESPAEVFELEGLCLWLGDDRAAKEELYLFDDAARIRKAGNCCHLKGNIVAVNDFDENPIVSEACRCLAAGLSLVGLAGLNDRVVLVVLHDPNSQAFALLYHSFSGLDDVPAVGLDDRESSSCVSFIPEHEVILEQYLADIVEVSHPQAGLGDGETHEFDVGLDEQLEGMDAVDGVRKGGLELAAGLRVEHYLEAGCPVLPNYLRSVVAFRKDG